MRRLYAWLAGFVGGAAVYRALKRTSRSAVEVDPASELKAKLAEARAEGGDGDKVATVETPVGEAAETDVEARRQSVHDQARAAIDEMQSDS